MYLICIANVLGMYHECIAAVTAMYLSCIMDVLDVVPHTSVFLHTLPSPFWGPAYQGIQFWASAAHGSGSWRVGTAMAWQHQTCFLACRAWMFQHALLGAVQQIYPWAGIHMGPLHSMLQA